MEITEPLEALMADLSPEVDFAQDDLEILDDNDFSLSAEEAIHGLDSVKWKEAMQLEIDALLKNETWGTCYTSRKPKYHLKQMGFDQEI